MRRIVAFILLLILTACSTGGGLAELEITESPVITPTQIATHTPIPTATQTATPAPTSTATLIPLSEEDLGMLNQVYRILLYVQIDMRMLDEIALKVQEEELVGVETFGALMVLATVVNEVDNAILTAEPPDLIREEWDAAMQYQEETKQLIEDWVNEDLDSMGVRAATQEKLVEIDALMETVEMTLAEYYGLDQNELRLNRESVVESVNEIFATPEE